MKDDANEKLEQLEQKIRKQAADYDAVEKKLREISGNLYNSVAEYQKTREKAQRDIWKKENKGWCHGCEKFHPASSLRLLATSARKYPEIKTSPSHWRISSYCWRCADIKLSSYRGGEENWQCFRARKSGKGFVIYVSGEWQPIDMNTEPKPEIKIERTGYISESEYQVGKNIIFQGYPAKLFIDQGEVVKVFL